MADEKFPDRLPARAASSGASPGREKRDTVEGCRERAAQDRLQAAAAGTGNGRQVLERSAGKWDKRAEAIEAAENDSDGQRIADRALWESGEAAETGPRRKS